MARMRGTPRGSLSDVCMVFVTDQMTTWWIINWLVSCTLAARLLFGDGSARWDGDLAYRVSVPKWVQGTQSRPPEAMTELPGVLVGAPETFRQNVQTDDP